ncbi:oxygenase MpaB family protein [Streptomyces sp. GbtcB7]|uniref:oxygenase MpaB family protein n=1 Tax=Streptomyces sp. GbtcB7 TaxID=2824752 RepID=UPI001C30B1B0|nr:oxygenase MpaB family protein [Streptomyces sp. GbtcB7]
MTTQSVADGRTAFIEQSLHVGDPVADAVIVELDEFGAAGRRLLNEGLRGGLASLADAPPAIAALLRESEATPDWVDTERLAAGETAFLSVEPLWTQIVLSVGSLLPGYSTPRIARVLTGTGRLVNTTQRRLQETGKWLNSVTLPGGMLPGAPGYVDTVQVRLMHARVRATNMRHGWDTGALGVPINQADVARTWLDFTYSPFIALEKLGVTFTDEELLGLYRHWHYVAHLMGVDPVFYRDVVDHQQAGEWYHAIEAVSDSPDENAVALSSSLLEVVTRMLSELALKTPLPLTQDLVAAFARRILGDQLCDQLGIAQTDLVPLVDLLAERNAQTRRWQRASPEAWQQALEENIGVRRFLVDLTEGATTYQQNLA